MIRETYEDNARNMTRVDKEWYHCASTTPGEVCADYLPPRMKILLKGHEFCLEKS
jgi:hypothetical protein